MFSESYESLICSYEWSKGKLDYVYVLLPFQTILLMTPTKFSHESSLKYVTIYLGYFSIIVAEIIPMELT